MVGEFDKLALDQSKIELSRIEGVAVKGDWVPVNHGDSVFMLPIQLELLRAIPANDIPKYSTWSIIVDFDEDKWGKVQIHPSLDDNAITKTYAHQQYNGGSHESLPVRNGHICTMSSIHGLSITKNAVTTEPKYSIERIIWHVERALEWLKAAATNSLSNGGDSFELPDFNIPKATQPLFLAYNESSDSYDVWKTLTGKAGIASVSMLNSTIIIRKYLSKNGSQTYYEPQWGNYITNLRERSAIWVCFDQIPVLNHWQIPSTSKELIIAANAQKIDLVSIIKGVLENLDDNSECFVLVGMPVSKKVGDKSFRLHWQAFSLPAANQVRSPKMRAQLIVNHLQAKLPTPIKWFVVSENWHPDDLQNRGSLNKTLRESDVLLIGCGALGSAIGELLVRMGVKKLMVIDKELFDPGNLVRHKLTLNSINKSKAIELAKYLNTLSPVTVVEGLSVTIPCKDKAFLEQIKRTSLIIDCSADDGLMSELPFEGLHQNAKIISCSMGLHANRLFFYADVANSFDESNFNSWFQPFREQEHKIAENEELPRGAGCWNPITPAKLNRISGLAGVAIEFIEQVVAEDIISPVAICHEWQVPQLNLSTKIKAA
ncbi:MAG: ThiF family adenylyltransferase [Bacteroidetes bacterium]|jgi:hypothetical protein|nr:ThiF family adenylyltransferase [Bacteroidota bacterium]